ncbi:hypothetical protein [Methylorubrum aminovorans]
MGAAVADPIFDRASSQGRWVCTVLLAAPAYVPPVAAVLGLVPPDIGMWALILFASLVPLVIGQSAAVAADAYKRARRR